jgi:folate-dependent tRNA-U54 methylase TrmFO/GidA
MTALGALIGHITGGHIEGSEAGGPRSFQPMNVNFGLFPPIEVPERDSEGRRIKGKDKAAAKRRATAERALAALAQWQSSFEGMPTPVGTDDAPVPSSAPKSLPRAGTSLPSGHR